MKIYGIYDIYPGTIWTQISPNYDTYWCKCHLKTGVEIEQIPFKLKGKYLVSEVDGISLEFKITKTLDNGISILDNGNLSVMGEWLESTGKTLVPEARHYNKRLPQLGEIDIIKAAFQDIHSARFVQYLKVKDQVRILFHHGDLSGQHKCTYPYQIRVSADLVHESKIHQLTTAIKEFIGAERERLSAKAN